MADQWYYQAFGQEFGPLTLDELAQMRHEGALSDDDLVRDGSSGSWIPATESKILSERANSIAVDSAELATDIDSFMLLDEKQESQNEFSFMPAPSIKAAPAESRGMWYFQSIGQEFGPVPFSELLEMAGRGEVGPEDSVRKGEAGQWVPAGLIEGLFPEQDSDSDDNDDDDDDDFAVAADVAPTIHSRVTSTRGVQAQASSRSQPTLQRESTYSQPASHYETAALTGGWYCYLNDQEYGPVELSELQGYATSGQITPEVYVRYGSDGEWIAAGQVPELYAPAPAVPQPAPAAAPSASSVVESERMELAHQLLALLKREISPEMFGNSAPPAVGGWYCNISGSVVGPVTIDSLVQMVLQKRIFAEDMIRLGTTGEWFPAKTVPELFPQQGGAGKKKSGLDDPASVLSKIDKMYKDAQEAKERTEAERAKAVANGTAPREAPKPEVKPAASGDVMRNLNSSIARMAVATPAEKKKMAGSSSSGDGSFAEQLDDLLAKVGLRGKGLYVGIVLAVMGLGYYFGPTLMSGFVASASYDGMMAIHADVLKAHKSGEAGWDGKIKDVKKKIKDLMAKVKGGATNTSLRDVSKMGLYLQEMAEYATKPPAAGVPPEEDPYEVAQLRFKDMQKKAAKKLGKKP